MESETAVPHEDQTVLIQRKVGLLGSISSSANWFVYIALFSMANSLIFFLGGSVTFLVGLGVTQLIDAVVYLIARDVPGDWATAVRLMGFGADIVFAWIFIGAAILAKKNFRWAFPAGMALYVLDGLLLVLFQDWLAAGFHAFALFILWRGFQAVGTLRGLEKDGAIVVPAGMMPVSKPLIQVPQKTSTLIVVVCLFLLILLFACILVGIPLLGGGQ